jgi:two-component system, OmpR family, response regulator RegX3
MTSARILFVEDEASIAEPFMQALRRAGFEPISARTGHEALAVARRMDLDLVLLDLALPDTDGRDVCRELRRRSDVPIIMVTARGTETDRIVGLELGADDYVVKPFSGDEVIARIRAVLRRGRRDVAAAEPVTVGSLRVDPAARRAMLRGVELDLTRREFDLLDRLVRESGHVVRREELMSEVWDDNWFGSTKTLDMHVATLRRKLGDDAADPRWLHTARGVGYRFVSAEEAP